MVSDPRNIGINGTMDIIVEEMGSGKEKQIRRALANFDTCLSKMKVFAKDPSVCRRFLDITFEYFPSRDTEVVSKLLDYLGYDDTSVLLYLVDKLIDIGNITLASSILGNLGQGQDLALREFILGRLEILVENMEGARHHFVRVVLTDPGFYRVYPYLDSIDPSYGWLHIANIFRVMDGDAPESYDGLVGGEREELFSICEQWSKGDRNGALAAIRRSHPYLRDDPFSLILFARMSAGTGSNPDAIDAYVRALDILKDSEFVSIELASAYRAIGDYDASTSILRKVKVFNPNSAKVLSAEYMSLIDDGRRQDACWTLETLMLTSELDAETLGQCISVLRAHDMWVEASNLTKRVYSRCIDRAYAECMMATDFLSKRDFRTAISHANAALRVDKGCVWARCIRAKAYLEMDGVTKAMQDVNRMLDDSPDDLMVLDVKKDIHMAIGHYDDALELCDYMLSIDPRDTKVMVDRAIILGLRGDQKGSLDAYREALHIDDDVKLFISILKGLLEQRRIDDLCRLVDDFDDVFGRSVLVWRLRGNAEYLAGLYDEAIVSYEKAVRLSPNEGDIWHSKGLAEEAVEQYEDAETSFGRALLVDLDNSEYWISMAVVQEKRGNIRGAIASLNKVITSANNGVFPLTMKARLLAKCGRVREALYFLDQAQRIEPFNVDVMRMSKDAFMHLGDHHKAMELCKRINSITGGDYGATVDLVSAYLINGDRASASSLLEQLVENKDLPFDILSRCATSYHQLGDFDKESELLERVLQLSPDDRSVMIRLAEAYAVSGNRESASEMYDRLEEKNPDDVSITVKKVMLDVDVDESEQEVFDTIVENLESMLDLAQRTLDSGMEDDALHLYQKVIDDDPDCADAHVAVMEIFMRQGRLVETIAMSSESSHMFPNDTRILKIMGDAYRSAGDSSKAADAYTEAMKLGMDTAELHGSAGLVLEDMGMMRMALDNYRIASEKDPLNMEYRLNMASLEMKVGHDDSAESLLNAILAVDPGNVPALRLFVMICCRRNDSEAILALFDDIMSAAVEDDDIRFFESALRDVGEYAKADKVGSKLLF